LNLPSSSVSSKKGPVPLSVGTFLDKTQFFLFILSLSLPFPLTFEMLLLPIERHKVVIKICKSEFKLQHDRKTDMKQTVDAVIR
jgi:hypothetical protein